ncbi:hypothetical protein E2562_000963 [Oryza meyeriana var. granulata]|uniref:F-box domain-containing protein n=1 Tax=Oryza meyeriana var. granulata TaxID=110450 RepID=A0A6G1CYK9_9ORYZ|nr:hypothetical protein E2562_000963 [Oryza meyeriana var. granulata]
MDIDGDGRERGGEGDSAALVPDAGEGGGEDRLSDLPDDVLACILGLLRDTHASAASNVLSNRWRDVWTWVSNLFLHHNKPHDPSPVRSALAAHAASAATRIRLLNVNSLYSARPDATTSWLCVAAPLVTGELSFRNRSSVPLEMLNDEVFKEIIEERGAFELPRFTSHQDLAEPVFLGLSLPPSGVFAALRELRLEHVQFHGECTLDDAMLPFLEWLEIRISL